VSVWNTPIKPPKIIARLNLAFGIFDKLLWYLKNIFINYKYLPTLLQREGYQIENILVAPYNVIFEAGKFCNSKIRISKVFNFDK